MLLSKDLGQSHWLIASIEREATTSSCAGAIEKGGQNEDGRYANEIEGPKTMIKFTGEFADRSEKKK